MEHSNGYEENFSFKEDHWIRCMANVVNLVVKEAVVEVGPLVSKVMAFLQAMHWSLSIKEMCFLSRFLSLFLSFSLSFFL